MGGAFATVLQCRGGAGGGGEGDLLFSLIDCFPVATRRVSTSRSGGYRNKLVLRDAVFARTKGRTEWQAAFCRETCLFGRCLRRGDYARVVSYGLRICLPFSEFFQPDCRKWSTTTTKKQRIEKTIWATLKTRKMRDKFCLVDSSALPQSLLADEKTRARIRRQTKFATRFQTFGR